MNGHANENPSAIGAALPKRIRKLRHLCLLLVLIMFSACRVLFSRPAESWLDPGWWNYTTVVEVQMRYDTRVSWNPLNQSSVSSGFESRIYLQPVRSAAGQALPESRAQAFELSRYPGWTLNGSVYALSDRIVLIRGTGDSQDRPGGVHREVFIQPLAATPATADADQTVLADGGADPMVLKPADGEYLLAAIPAPGEVDLLAVFLTRSTLEQRYGELLLDVYRYRGDGAIRKVSRRKIAWQGDPGMPDVAWARSGDRIYIKRLRDIVETTGDLTQTPASSGETGHRVATSFPGCFRATDSGSPVSLDGMLYVPEPVGSADSSQEPTGDEAAARTTRGFRLEPAPGWRNFADVRLISDFNRIGYGCR
ncbi:MAG: hypothetical protein NXI24_18920 [bacterium]|nr:hypothetical protein [bacterium]